MDDVIGMAEVKRISDGQDDLSDLGLIWTSVQIFVCIEFATLAVFHDYVKEARVVVDLVYFDDVGMFQLSVLKCTERRISH